MEQAENGYTTERNVGETNQRESYTSSWEEFPRGKTREHLQDLLEQAVTEWLGRKQSDLRTSNVVDSTFSRVWLRTAASRRFKSQINATCLRKTAGEKSRFERLGCFNVNNVPKHFVI
ncbi:MAG: hypothetical protein ACXWW4_17650 [Candidatus Binatia bacterium]